MQTLNDREKTILQNIVFSFIQTAVPVGSRFISKRRDIGLSPATIRNVMSDLEYMGYIGHPHTSAGRIPTDKGYRFYVDELMDLERLDEKDKNSITAHLSGNVEQDEIFKVASRILGTISNQLAVVSAPSMTSGIFEKLELLQVSSTRLLVIISLRLGLVKTIMMEMHAEISRSKLDQLARLLNEKLSGLTLMEIRDTFTERVKELRNEETGLVRLFIDSVDKLFSEDKNSKIHIGGTKNMLSQPEFENAKNFKTVIELVDNQDIIIHVLEKNDNTPHSTNVSIGKENRVEDLSDFSIVSANYTVGDMTGSIGVLGPKRMNYSKMIPLVDFVAQTISAMFHQ
jgi:heat-inducible transcriptional repressor